MKYYIKICILISKEREARSPCDISFTPHNTPKNMNIIIHTLPMKDHLYGGEVSGPWSCSQWAAELDGGQVCLPPSFCPDHSVAQLFTTWSQLEKTFMYELQAIQLHASHCYLHQCLWLLCDWDVTVWTLEIREEAWVTCPRSQSSHTWQNCAIRHHAFLQLMFITHSLCARVRRKCKISVLATLNISKIFFEWRCWLMQKLKNRHHQSISVSEIWL